MHNGKKITVKYSGGKFQVILIPVNGIFCLEWEDTSHFLIYEKFLMNILKNNENFNKNFQSGFQYN